jgi:predicted phage terminase large subunit-like protein
MNKYEEQRLKELVVLQTMCNEDVLFFTRYFFKQRFGRKFIVNWHHRVIADALNRVMRGELKRLIINIAPRYSKTELVVIDFIANALGINPKAKFIHLSYSDDLALENSEAIRDIIQLDDFKAIYGDLDIKKDSRGKKNWKTTKGGGVYATSTGGQVTGFGAGLVDDEEFLDSLMGDKSKFGGALIIDDPIKPDDADSDLVREAVNNKFDSTLRNRVNSPANTPIIIIGQRTHPHDLPGYLIQNEGKEWEVISIPTIYEEEGTEKALWPLKHSIEQLYDLRAKNIVVFERQYQQNPKPLEGLMYPMDWLTYDRVPFDVEIMKSQTDIADDGQCYLCSIKYAEFKGLKYVLDLVYTQEPTELTEKKCVLLNKEVNYASFESNNGGKAFARNVERMSREIGNYKTRFSWYFEHTNKDARILSNSSTVQNTIVFPRDWGIRWPKFYDHVTNYMLTGRNKYKDAPDVLTAMVEKKHQPRRNM